MNLNSENKQAIHEVVIADMQQRLYEDIGFANENDYAITLETLVEDVLHTSSIRDIVKCYTSMISCFQANILQ